MVHSFTWVTMLLELQHVFNSYIPFYLKVSIAVITKIRFYYFCIIDNFISYIITCTWLIIDNVPLYSNKSRITCFVYHIQCFFDVTFNESKEKFRIVFCCIPTMKNIVKPSYSSNFSTKLIPWGVLVLWWYK